MDMIGKVRRMRLRDELSLSEIAKRTGLSRNTVEKWLRAPSDVVPKYEWVKLDGKLTAFEAALHQALTPYVPSPTSIHANVRLHVKVPGIALLNLMHLGIARVALVLGRTGRGDDGRIHDGARAHQKALLGQVSIDLVEQCFG